MLAKWRIRHHGVMAAAQPLFLVVFITAGATPAAAGDRDEQPDPVALWAALEDAGTALEAGLIAAEQRGRPVSARFDMEDGDLELVVDIATDDGLYQMAVDPNIAAVLWAERISSSDDLADATAQKAAIERAKLSLLSVVQQTLREHQVARAVDVTPELRDGHPVAVITLLANGKFAKVSRWLE
jgi:hypothetical protein